MGLEMPKSSLFQNNSICEKNEKNFNICENKYQELKRYIFKTTQNNIIIPTGKLIKNKNIDIRILACISAISYVKDCSEVGSNTRYISVDKVNKNIVTIAKYLRLKPKKVKEEINKMLALKTNELELKCVVDEEGNVDSWFEINYLKGEFIILPYELFEGITDVLSSRAFKTYCNLRWICFSKSINDFEEKVITQEYLLKLIGLSVNSKKTIRDITDELLEMELITIRKGYIHDHKLFEKGVTKEVIYYSMVNMY